MSNFFAGRRSPARRKERHERRNPHYADRRHRPDQSAGGRPRAGKENRQDTYKVRVHFSDTSTETMSDKIKRMLKNEIQQM